MIGRTTPQAAGMPQQAIDRFLADLQRHEINMHSLLLLRGNDIFYERSWAPFSVEQPHRMYSITKTFTAIAIGLLLEEGKLSLDAPIIRYFPDKLPKEISPWLEKQTIRDMLMMSTCFAGGPSWFQPGLTDRAEYYFARQAVKPAGALFDYDSTGSCVLGILVERLSGLPLLDYLRAKVLNRLGGFDDAVILQNPDGTPWADSGLVCSPLALMNFARFVMNLGTWEGERLMSADYLRDATTPRTANDLEARPLFNSHGYGYQIWMTEQNGYCFFGMGGQFAICVPEKDFILVCTGDNQYNDPVQYDLFRAVFDDLVAALPGGEPWQPDPEAAPELSVAHGAAHSPLEAQLSGVEFVCDENPMGITRFHLEFSGEAGCFVYENAQGLKRLPFGLKQNWFGKFPQLGYSNDRGNVHELTDFKLDCASSAGWVEANKLQLRVQIIDRYFGSVVISFGFVGIEAAGVRMIHHAEDFLEEYEGWLAARRAD